MRLALAILSLVSRINDVLFDAAATILRVLIRGRFKPDATSFRGARYVELGAADIFLQETTLNAADAEQARRIIALDAERRLPLSLDTALFDIAGPTDGAEIRASPERRFLLGVVRNDILEARRLTLGPARARRVEGFVHRSDTNRAVLVFKDAPARRRGRFRRLVLTIALAALFTSAWQLEHAVGAALEAAAARADGERMQGERALRTAERRRQSLNSLLNAMNANHKPPLSAVSSALSLLATRLPPDAEIITVHVDASSMTLEGRTYAPDRLELELRRTFEAAPIAFSAEAGGAPQPFSARIAIDDSTPP